MEVDRSITYIAFFKDNISAKMEEEFEKIYHQHIKTFENIDSKLSYTIQTGGKEIIYYNGTIIIEYLIQKYNKKNNNPMNLRVPINMAVGVLFGISSGLIRLYYG